MPRITSLHASRSSSPGVGVQLRAGAEFDRLVPLPPPPGDSIEEKWMKPQRVGVSTRAGEGGKSGLSEFFCAGREKPCCRIPYPTA